MLAELSTPGSLQPERYHKLKSLFQTAVELRRSARSRFVEQACEGDQQLRAQLQRLLVADEQMGAFLESPALLVARRTTEHGMLPRRSTSPP